MSERASDITPSSKVSVALLGGILVVLTGTSWQASKWASTMEFQISTMNARIASLESTLQGAVGNHWTVSQMSSWAEQLRLLNPELKTPAVAK